MTYLAEVPRAPVLEGVSQPGSPEEHAIEDDSEWLGPGSGQHPPCVLEVEFVPALDQARMSRPGWIHLRYDTAKKIFRANLKAISELGGLFFTCPVLINLYGSIVVQPYK